MYLMQQLNPQNIEFILVYNIITLKVKKMYNFSPNLEEGYFIVYRYSTKYWELFHWTRISLNRKRPKYLVRNPELFCWNPFTTILYYSLKPKLVYKVFLTQHSFSRLKKFHWYNRPVSRGVDRSKRWVENWIIGNCT